MEHVGEAFAIVAGLGLAGSLLFFVPLWGPQVAFKGLIARSPPNPESALPSFSMADGGVLTAFLAIANALVGLQRDEITLAWLIAMAVAANSLVVLLWIKCQRFMQRHGIIDRRSRLLMQAFLYPSSVFVIAQTVMASLVLIEGLRIPFDNDEVGKEFAMPLMFAAAIGLAASIGALCILRWLFRRYIVLGPAVPARLRHRSGIFDDAV